MNSDDEALIHNDDYTALDALKFAVMLRASTNAGRPWIDLRYTVLEDADAFYQWIVQKRKDSQ